MSQPAISITLYGENDEKIKTFERAIIPWGILKKATRLVEKFQTDRQTGNKEAPETQTKKKWFFLRDEPQPAEHTEEMQMQAISEFVVDLFGNQFTVKQLEDGADVGEIMTVFRTVLSRANATVKLNPTMLQAAKKSRTRT